MDDAVRAREASREAVAGVVPRRLNAVIDDRLADASMAPATLALQVARTVAAEPWTPSEGATERAAGVQLIYEGLRLTRRLARDPPWATAGGDAPAGDIAADLDVVAADVLVSRGFYLLARTPAAGRAVEVVRAFGRDQTERREAADPAELDRELEADVLALAAATGAATAGREATPAVVDYAAGLGRRLGTERGLPPAERALDAAVRDRLAALAAGPDDDEGGSDPDPVARSTGDR